SEVNISESHVRFMGLIGEMKTDGGGQFRFAQASPGAIRLDVRAEGHEPSGWLELTVVDAADEIEIVLPRAGRLRFRGTKEDGTVAQPSEVIVVEGASEVLVAGFAEGKCTSFSRTARHCEVRGVTGSIPPGRTEPGPERPERDADGYF